MPTATFGLPTAPLSARLPCRTHKAPKCSVNRILPPDPQEPTLKPPEAIIKWTKADECLLQPKRMNQLHPQPRNTVCTAIPQYRAQRHTATPSPCCTLQLPATAESVSAKQQHARRRRQKEPKTARFPGRFPNKTQPSWSVAAKTGRTRIAAIGPQAGRIRGLLVEQNGMDSFVRNASQDSGRPNDWGNGGAS